jgi:hypothetical protein
VTSLFACGASFCCYACVAARELMDTCLVLETAARTSLPLSVHLAVNMFRNLTNKDSAVSYYFRAEYSPEEHAHSLETP